MNPVKLVGESLRAASHATQFVRPQATERRDLIADIRGVCERCERAYGTVLERLRPLSSCDRGTLAGALRQFSADRETRAAFKPEKLSGDVTGILQRLERDVDRVMYPADFWRIYRLESAVANPEAHDQDLSDYYDDYARSMDVLAGHLEASLPGVEALERQAYAQHVIASFEADLEETLRDIGAAKEEVAGVA
jgi:hypothetical protein